MSYNLKISKKQAEVISKAMEVYTRLGIGQIDTAIEEVYLEKLFLEGAKTESVEVVLDRKDRVRTLCDELKRILTGFTSNASYGIGSPDISDDFRIGYDIKKTINHVLYKERNPNEGIGWHVDSSPPIQFGKEAMPKMEKF